MTLTAKSAWGAWRAAKRRARRAQRRLYLRDYDRANPQSLARACADAEARVHDRYDAWLKVSVANHDKRLAREDERRVRASKREAVRAELYAAEARARRARIEAMYGS